MKVNGKAQVRRGQLQQFAESAKEGITELVQSQLQAMGEVATEARLPLIDLTTAALRELTASQYSIFRGNVVALMKADEKLSLFEWVLQRMILRHLEPQFKKVETARVKHHSLARLEHPCAVLLSALSHSGHHDPAGAQSAFEQGRSRLELPRLQLLDRRQCGLAELDEALTVLDTVTFKLKRDLLEAGVACVSADKRVTVVEGELLRDTADALGCPMPPLLPGQPI